MTNEEKITLFSNKIMQARIELTAARKNKRSVDADKLLGKIAGYEATMEALFVLQAEEAK